jgi:hypothetical protein
MDTKKLGRFAQPGRAVTGDRTQRSRRVGWEFVHSIVEDCSRLPTQRSTTTRPPRR